MTSVLRGAADFIAWLPSQFEQTDVVKGVNDLICDAVAIGDMLPKVVQKVEFVVPESLRAAAHFAKTYNWCRNFFNPADRIKEWGEIDLSRCSNCRLTTMVSLTIAHALGFFQSLQDIQLISLGSLAAPCKLLQNALYIPASTCSAKDSWDKWSQVAGERNLEINFPINPSSGWVAANAILRGEAVAVAQEVLNLRNQGVADTDPTLAFWLFVQSNYNRLGEVSSKLTFEGPLNGPFYVSTRPIADRNYRIKSLKEGLSFIENVAKAALGIIGLTAMYLGASTVALFSFGMILGWTAVHLIGVGKKLFGNACKVEAVTDFTFPPNIDRAFAR